MIYIITRQPFPDGMAGTNRIKCYARALLQGGIPCKVFIFSRDDLNSLSHGNIRGVNYRYVLNYSKRWKGKLGSFQTLLMMGALYLHLLVNLKKGDIVFEYSRETYKFINCVIKLTHLKKAKFISELCEIPGLGFNNKEAIYEKQYITNKLFPQYDGVIAISDNLIQYASQYTSSHCKHIKIPVLVDVEDFKLDNNRLIQEPYVFYSGSFDDQKDGTIGMFEAFRIVSKKYKCPLKFVCTGTKEDALKTGYLNDIISDKDLSGHLIFTGYLTHDKIITYLKHCELVISARYTNAQTKNGFSTKLAEYAASGKALILTPVGEAVLWFQSGINCLMVPENDSRALADAIMILLSNGEERLRLANNIYQTSCNCFDYRAWSGSLKQFMESLN